MFFGPKFPPRRSFRESLVFFRERYDWTTRVPDNGNDRRKFRVVPSLAPLASPCFVLCLIGVETEGLLDYQGRAGIISIVRWNLRPVIFGGEVCMLGSIVTHKNITYI